MAAVQGELWTDARGLYVRSGSVFHKCSSDLVPKGAREYDLVTAIIDVDHSIKQILTHTREPIHRRPRGFRPPAGVFVGKVTSYTRDLGGYIDYDTPFCKEDVKAIGEGEVQVGEIIEYSMNKGVVVSVTGPFNTAVTAVGRRLK